MLWIHSSICRQKSSILRPFFVSNVKQTFRHLIYHCQKNQAKKQYRWMIDVKLKLNSMLFKFYVQIIRICCTLRNNLLLGPQNNRVPFHSVLRKYILEEGCIDAGCFFVQFDFLGVVKLPPLQCNQRCFVDCVQKSKILHNVLVGVQDGNTGLASPKTV